MTLLSEIGVDSMKIYFSLASPDQEHRNNASLNYFQFNFRLYRRKADFIIRDFFVLLLMVFIQIYQFSVSFSFLKKTIYY